MPVLKILQKNTRRMGWALPWLRASAATWLALAALAGLGAPGIAWGAPAPVTLVIHAGFDGYYKDQRWLPVRITVSNDGPDTKGTLQVTVPRGGGGAAVMVTREVDLPTQSRREVFLYIPIDGYLSNLKVSLNDGQNDLATATTRLVQAGAGDLIFGVMAGSPSAFNILSSVKPVNGSAFVAQLDAADLPPLSYAWHALDVLVISDVDTGVLSTDQRAALAEWVAAGGRLIVAGGPTWQKTAAGLAALLPLAPAGTQTLPDTSALSAFASSTAPLTGPVVAATGSLAPDAVTLLSAGTLPLVITRHSGFGQVLFLAVDPAFDPLKNWIGQEGLYRNLLSGTAQRPNWAAGLRNWYAARDALNALPGLQLPSALEISGFLALYILAVGPLNYLILRRLKRRELAWITVPLLVVVFSTGAYITGYQLRGGQASLHRLAVVQVWPNADRARVDGLVGLFSPRRTQYDLVFGPGLLAEPMPSDAGSPGASSFTVQQSDGTVIPGIRLEVGAVEPFVVQGQAAAPAFDANLAINANGTQVTLQGQVTNRSDIALTDAVLLAPGGVQRLGNLAPGASASINLPLTNAHATLASPGDVLPAQASAATQPAAPASAPSTPGNYDSTIDDILGNTYYYNDREQFRRYSLLSSIIDTYSGAVRGDGVYLVGWSNQSPLTVQVTNHSYQTVDSSLYFVSLAPKLSLGASALAIPPGLMTWLPLDPSPTVSPTPYDLYLYQNTGVTLRFLPAPVLPNEKVQGLTLHLLSYGLTGKANLNLDLWDFTINDWARQAPQNWGDINLSNPDHFVGPAGEIKVRAYNPTTSQISVERLDFTLLVGQ